MTNFLYSSGGIFLLKSYSLRDSSTERCITWLSFALSVSKSANNCPNSSDVDKANNSEDKVPIVSERRSVPFFGAPVRRSQYNKERASLYACILLTWSLYCFSSVNIIPPHLLCLIIVS